jgi:microcystin-dependent protein
MAFARKTSLYLSAAAVAAGTGLSGSASAQDFYLGELMKVPYNFCPRGTLEANGQLVSIAQESALYALYGTTYGGDGVTTFAMPGMAGRHSMHEGTGAGLSPRVRGQTGGTETTTLTMNQMPRHEHTASIRTTSSAGNTGQSFRAIFATTPANKYVSGTAPAAQLMNINTLDIRHTGEGTSFDHLPPYLAIRYCVISAGIFPSRN